MSRPMAWICLIVALAGPSLAHAEAADDLARSQAGMQDVGEVRPIDGGVGDDPIEASFGPSSPGQVVDHPTWPAPFAAAIDHVSGPLQAGSTSAHLRLGGDPRPFPATVRRHVWLQIFLN